MESFHNSEYLDTEAIIEYIRLYFTVTRERKFELLAVRLLKYYMGKKLKHTGRHTANIDAYIEHGDLSLLGEISDTDLTNIKTAFFTMKTAKDKPSLQNALRKNMRNVPLNMQRFIGEKSFVWCMVINKSLTPLEKSKLINYASSNGIEKAIVLDTNEILELLIENRDQAIDLAGYLKIQLPDKNYKYHDLNLSVAAAEIMLKLNEIWNEKFRPEIYTKDLHEIEEFFKMRYVLATDYLATEKRNLLIGNESVKELDCTNIASVDALKLSLKLAELDTVYDCYAPDKDSIIFIESDEIPNKIENVGTLVAHDDKIQIKDLAVVLEFYLLVRKRIVQHAIELKHINKNLRSGENPKILRRPDFSVIFHEYLQLGNEKSRPSDIISETLMIPAIRYYLSYY